MVEDKYWTEYWKSDGKNGEVFINVQGHKPDYLNTFWNDNLLNVSKNSSVLDVACGGGSIFSTLSNPNNFKLYGTDISEEALKHAKTKIKKLTALQCSSDDIPLPSSSIDLIVSQFGIEYAGNKAFLEAIRLLKNGGKFIFLTHILGGQISNQTAGRLEGALLVEKLEFCETAAELAEAIYEGQQSTVETAHDKFSKVEPVLFDYVNKHPNGVHSQLYNGFRKLLVERNKYLLKDILDWLSSIKVEVNNNIVRLQQMQNAALSEDHLLELRALCAELGATFTFEAFSPNAGDLPIGWLVKGKKA